MTNAKTDESRTAAGLGFLEKLKHVFYGRETNTAAPDPAGEALAALEQEFESAIGEIQERVESLRDSRPGDSGGSTHASAADREAARTARLAKIHDRMRADIEKMHARLGSGIGSGDLDRTLEGLAELDQISRAGYDSHDLLPRARHAIAERLRKEAGELAVERLRTLLERDQQTWPDPTHYRPHASEEEIERSRRRRLAETRETFLAQDFARIAQRAVGIVSGWGADYPEPDSPLWQECVLEGVGAGIRGELCLACLETLRQNADALVAGCEEVIGKQVEGLRGQLDAGIRSIGAANRAVGSALTAVDVVTPDVAWRLVVEKLPRARGEWDD